MQIAIVHYHLNRGGVTQVIANHLQSLDVALDGDEPLTVALLYGGRREGWSDDVTGKLKNLQVHLREVPELEYDQGATVNSDRLAAALREHLGAIGFDPERTVVHVHNHALGKNVSLPGALVELTQDGYALLLQIHDFGEDFRPDVYNRLGQALCPDAPERLPTFLYPQAESIHYAALNRRDAEVLRAAGVKPQQLHLLPNPVADFGQLPPAGEIRERLAARRGIAKDSRLILYPVRGIRRKNMGELLLWSAVVPQRAALACTLAPLNPVERGPYDRWKVLAEQEKLSCYFELGDDFTFVENLAAADAVITTSVAEGFGMVFLEAWLAGRPLIGRNLSEITADFVADGLALDWMVARLAVPVDWIGKDKVRREMFEVYREALAGFARAPLADETALELEFDQLIEDGTIDFASLVVGHQCEVIQRVARSVDCRGQLLELNPQLATACELSDEETTSVIAHNQGVVRDHYGPAVSGRRLRDLYATVAASGRGGAVLGPPRGDQILDLFLNLRRFRPVRCQT